ncbi:hypothetical protein F2P56_014199 [Juglans regia]|uniref:Anaphase-promoting complex subunit 11 RING-H2 finger domain-containing protein n=1 Tax=Juglans regia TaxID=51240 RepID=A0A833XC11_JUGRE|nr:hypothetical protein F2P56_013764 [Juglans regia]KAF5464090.1 hypothetical protein F2P56_014199 [Juglans regia]
MIISSKLFALKVGLVLQEKRMKVKLLRIFPMILVRSLYISWHAVASWTWDAQDETCGICRMAFDGCCPDCKLPGDDCPLRNDLYFRSLILQFGAHATMHSIFTAS